MAGGSAYYVEASMGDTNRFTGRSTTSYSIYVLNRQEAERVLALDSSVDGIFRKSGEEGRQPTRSERRRMDGMHQERISILEAPGRRTHTTEAVPGTPFRVGAVLSQEEFERLRIRSSRTLGQAQRR